MGAFLIERFNTPNGAKFYLAGLGRSVRLFAGATQGLLRAHGDPGSIHAEIRSVAEEEHRKDRCNDVRLRRFLRPGLLRFSPPAWHPRPRRPVPSTFE